MARRFTQLRESAAIDNFLAGTSQAPVRPRSGPPAEGLPPSTLTKTEAEDLARPRMGSRSAAPAAADRRGVVPASLDAPVSR
jgi:hypothetical protein